MTVKERLEQYIKEDKIYQDFIDSKVRIKDLTDFDLYCIQHCIDIEELLEENKELKEKFKATNKGLQKVVLKRKKWKHRYQLARCEIKELKRQNEFLMKRDNKCQMLEQQYCERTDCSGRLGTSKKVEALEKENQELKKHLEVPETCILKTLEDYKSYYNDTTKRVYKIFRR